MKAYFGERPGCSTPATTRWSAPKSGNGCKARGENRFDLVLGARSAVFLPMSRLGLIIVDEEHEPSYKQQDPAPRYHGRDTAIVLGKFSGANVLLGSATPSVESYHHAETGKYTLAELPRRYGEVEMPRISVVDIREAYAQGRMKGHFSLELIEAVQEALAEKKQVILFQNRRGYAPVVQCRATAVGYRNATTAR